jgi:hypothetical protein
MNQTFIGSGIAAYADTGAVIKLEAFADFTTPAVKHELDTAPYAYWGSNNQQPIKMAELIDKCGVLNAGIEAKARICIGKGLKPVLVSGISKNGDEEYEFIYDEEIENWLSDNTHFQNNLTSVRNIIGYGWTHERIILNGAGDKIAKWKVDDVSNCRLGKKNEKSKIDKTYLAADWTNISSGDSDSNYLKPIACLEEGNELEHLTKSMKNRSNPKEFSIINRGYLNIKNYYPNPLWYSARDWVEMTVKVPAMKVAMMNNQMSIKYIITISEQYFMQGDEKWDEYDSTQKQKMFEEKSAEINRALVGNDKAYKSITTKTYIDPVSRVEVPLIKIDVIDDKVKDGKLLPDSGAGNKEILFALMMNPAINGANTFGGDYSGGAGSGSDIREAYLVQIMLMEAERHMNYKIMNLVKRVNGWAEKYKGKKLEFRYPNLILTTLDTGGSTAPTA